MAEIGYAVGRQLRVAATQQPVKSRADREQIARRGNRARVNADRSAKRVAELAVAPAAGFSIIRLDDELRRRVGEREDEEEPG
jgi:hypothetical protein